MVAYILPKYFIALEMGKRCRNFKYLFYYPEICICLDAVLLLAWKTKLVINYLLETYLYLSLGTY